MPPGGSAAGRLARARLAASVRRAGRPARNQNPAGRIPAQIAPGHRGR